MSKPPKTRDPFKEIADQLRIDNLTDELVMLREQYRLDPPRGAPMKVDLSGDGQLVDLDPGCWRGGDENASYSMCFGTLPANCPVSPLGADEKYCYFISPLGHIVTLGVTAGKTPITFLFGGRSRFLEWAWPRYGAARGKGPAPVTGWAAEDALPALVDAANLKGSFSMEDQVRGRGAWLHDDGSLIYHAGDSVWIEGEWRACGEHGRHIYAARPRLGRPALNFEREGPGSPGDAMLETLKTFNWDRGDMDAHLCLGWYMTARVGGALRRRPTAFINGEEGSGKTTLQELLRLGMNGALMSTSNTTQAGIYQRVRQDSVAIMVDELEAKDDTRVVDKILELARIAYSGDKMQRGGKDGEGKEFALMSSFMGSSISKPPMGAQDDSRMVSLTLRPLTVTSTLTPAEIDARTIAQWGKDLDSDSPINAKDVERWGRELLRRWFEWWPRWPALLRVFRQALIVVGHDNRSADTFAPLAAACHVALHDGMPTPDQLKPWLEWLAAADLTETATKEKTWRRVFTHLLDAQPAVLAHGAVRSIGEALKRWRDNTGYSLDEVQRIVGLCGMAISFEEDQPVHVFETARLFVPAKSPALYQLFEGTSWHGNLGAPGPWCGVLRQMPEHLFRNGKCDKNLDRKASGMFINIAEALAL